MTQSELLEEFQALDFSGRLSDVLSRISTEAYEAFAEGVNSGQADAVVYFGMRRLAAERGTDSLLADSFDLYTLAEHSRHVLVLARMERQGRMMVEWPDSPISDPAQPIRMRPTAAGRAHHAILKQKMTSGSTN